jgi:hypothetical protein
MFVFTPGIQVRKSQAPEGSSLFEQFFEQLLNNAANLTSNPLMPLNIIKKL